MDQDQGPHFVRLLLAERIWDILNKPVSRRRGIEMTRTIAFVEPFQGSGICNDVPRVALRLPWVARGPSHYLERVSQKVCTCRNRAQRFTCMLSSRRRIERHSSPTRVCVKKPTPTWPVLAGKSAYRLSLLVVSRTMSTHLRYDVERSIPLASPIRREVRGMVEGSSAVPQPRAFFRASTWSNCSQVKFSSGRPKWP